MRKKKFNKGIFKLKRVTTRTQCVLKTVEQKPIKKHGKS